ncbi:hypothetical protein EYF80_008086 [Liparis tanakae]|uniref:Uncharacterized protein n=1 Tax=Liparis tanakae TaxID=230148 RepID=A0A4Z2IUH6_9TELE|nr:hypothetical protein EYF80_008086 [Liparis tanakae]
MGCSQRAARGQPDRNQRAPRGQPWSSQRLDIRSAMREARSVRGQPEVSQRATRGQPEGTQRTAMEQPEGSQRLAIRSAMREARDLAKGRGSRQLALAVSLGANSAGILSLGKLAAHRSMPREAR